MVIGLAPPVSTVRTIKGLERPAMRQIQIMIHVRKLTNATKYFSSFQKYIWRGVSTSVATEKVGGCGQVVSLRGMSATAMVLI